MRRQTQPSPCPLSTKASIQVNATRAGSDLERSGYARHQSTATPYDYDGSQFSDACVRQMEGDIAEQAPWTFEVGVAATVVSVKIIASVPPVGARSRWGFAAARKRPGLTTIVVVTVGTRPPIITIVWVPGVSGFKSMTEPCATDRPVVAAGMFGPAREC